MRQGYIPGEISAPLPGNRFAASFASSTFKFMTLAIDLQRCEPDGVAKMQLQQNIVERRGKQSRDQVVE